MRAMGGKGERDPDDWAVGGKGERDPDDGLFEDAAEATAIEARLDSGQ